MICNANFDLRAAVDFNLTQTATVSVPRLARELRLLFANGPLPRVIIVEIGTNDLSSQPPVVVIGEVLDLVDFLQSVAFSQYSCRYLQSSSAATRHGFASGGFQQWGRPVQ